MMSGGKVLKCPKNRLPYILPKFSINVLTTWGNRRTLILKRGKKRSSGDAWQGKESIQRDQSGAGEEDSWCLIYLLPFRLGAFNKDWLLQK